MITIVGTGHVFNISEPIKFIIKEIWPQAVLVELDITRFNAMTAAKKESEEGKTDSEQPNKEQSQKSNDKDLPWIYRNTAKYQKRVAKGNSSDVGNEMLTAVLTGRLIGAEIGFIDSNAANVMTEIWDEMSFGERTRYVLSTFKDRIGGKKEADRVVKDFSENEDKMMADMRRKYPTMMRKLIDERNDHMFNEIQRYTEKYDEIVVVVGDAHVEGLAALLSDKKIRKIRLGDILEKERLDKIRKELWDRKSEENEG